MAGVGIRINTGAARQDIREMISRAANPAPLLNSIGEYGMSIVERKFQKSGPGWPAKHPYFAELQRRTGGMNSGQKALFATGTLMKSIVYEVRGQGVRVGSPERYAATQQLGSGGPRSFYLYIIPDMEKGKRGLRIKRNDKGFVLGKLVEKREFDEKTAVRQLITINVRPRPFIEPPSDYDWERIGNLATRHLAGKGGGS